ncbi:MAG: hypothetical protein R2568_07520 [Candidatus Scalindua sp.]|jgi:hemerythrin|nr:hypothetical protein [Candidatus Scalindua sp.]
MSLVLSFTVVIEWEERFSVGISIIDEQHKKLINIINKTINYRNKMIEDDYHMACEILEFLKKWLVDHILVTDKEYVDCFKKSGLK